MGRVREKIRVEERRVEERKGKSQQIEDTGAKCWESRETLCFSNDVWVGGSKSRLAKVAGAEPSGQMRDEKLHAVVAKNCRVRSTFGN